MPDADGEALAEAADGHLDGDRAVVGAHPADDALIDRVGSVGELDLPERLEGQLGDGHWETEMRVRI